MYVFMFRFWIFISVAQDQNLKEEEIVLIGYMTVVVIVLSAMVITFFIAFQKRKHKLLMDQIQQQKHFEDTVADIREEIQEQTLQYIGQELHDNVGQLLSLASMQMGMIETTVAENLKQPFHETQKIIKDSLTEVRTLSKTLNMDVIQNQGFIESVQIEIDRLNRLKLIQAKVISLGTPKNFENKKDGIILFRILQEFISNTIKHASASELIISLEYTADQLLIKATDDGKGFLVEEAMAGSGLLNMRNRATLIESEFHLTARPHEGTTLKIHYPMRLRNLKLST